jgi:hypothetical protein
MTTLKPQPAHTDNLAAGAWAAVALTPFGWFFGALAVAFSNEGDHPIVSQMIMGVLLFVAAPTSAFVLAVHAARAGHRSGKIAVVVSGLLLLATLVCTLLVRLPNGWWWIGLAVTAVVAVLVLAGVCSRRIAVVVSGLLLAAVVFSLLGGGGWIGLAVIALIAVLVFAWAQSRNKPPPGPDGTQREERSPADTAPPGASERTS